MDRGRRRRAAVAGAARVLAGRNGSRSTSSSRSCSPLSPPFSFSSSSAAASRQPREDAREREVSPSACQPVRLRAARRGSHRGGGGGSGSIAPPHPPGSPRSRGGRGAGVGSGLRARAPGGGCAQARRPRGLRAGPAEPGPGLQLDPRRRQRRRRGLTRPRRGDHAPFWLAPLRVPSALAAREAGFGAQPGAGGANHGRRSGRGRRVGEAGRPRPGTRRCSAGPRDPGQRRAGARGGVLAGVSIRPSAAPARPLRWLPACPARRPRPADARRLVPASCAPGLPAPPAGAWRTGPRRAPRPRSTPEETGGKV
ncbi:translation initiation factor IF-2-like [Cervus canadensis]|uniref:translation initiation factor IF-2-like n=1 Tax=Cervus canadensis TaxID=1574408 RepID=UPI001C9E5FB5|nr:translation initiation factor IF-2-like [Cervus canadensis]XP_043325203.1 translation initiation factor IF-2-like [Cervus canadensis]XP_043325204.1 translation initiation factor IF-2-like [Cervus canadensis]XP_043325205.1 translation initiation factor IF-2-like [Cervus canadensis]XP_043325206.1 translation initiation factor IF-2-like [Cervus canadensis]XP_043325207.1 translation initiation factor IF-2-like [Cervus canadensis]XP_043325208.1 translation initiation factor IF-2-like [Cervus ca